MKPQFHIVLFLMLLFLSACDKPIVPKPKELIHEKQMIDMLVDIHLADETYKKFRNDSIMENNSAENFYYSVLAKYEVPDSVFEQSYVYYASTPKDFEKMYRKVMTRLSEMEQDLSGRKDELLKFDEDDKPSREK